MTTTKKFVRVDNVEALLGNTVEYGRKTGPEMMVVEDIVTGLSKTINCYNRMRRAHFTKAFPAVKLVMRPVAGGPAITRKPLANEVILLVVEA